jgi:Overcoming lysogenization defect protein-like, TOPRIM domain
MRMSSIEIPDVSSARTAVLVEGESDCLAVEALARHRGSKPHTEAIAVVPMGGSKNINRFLDRYGPVGLDLHLAGMCDAREEGDFRRALERAELGRDLTRAGMERLGFYVCEEDLEDELIRALGADRVEGVLDRLGVLDPFRTFQKQPQWHGRPIEEQLRRFIGTASGRKALAAPLLVEALDLDHVPRPLDGVLSHA